MPNFDPWNLFVIFSGKDHAHLFYTQSIQMLNTGTLRSDGSISYLAGGSAHPTTNILTILCPRLEPDRYCALINKINLPFRQALYLMKKHHRLLWLCLIFSMLAIGSASAQEGPGDDFGSGIINPPMDLTTDIERALIDAEVAKNITRLTAEGKLPAMVEDEVRFSFPLRAAAHLHDYSFYGVSGFMDHNPNYNALLDYMCGDRTYDISGYNHSGTDFFTYPFPWLKMDNKEVEIIAAAVGTIVFKRDGQFDRRCALTTGVYSNAIVLRHADGTMTHYLHMKDGSPTTKAVGAVVAVGEYLGVVGSSGSSTGSHLHFEVRSASNAVIDPYEGPCNARPSMWEAQPSYYDSAVIAVHTGSNRPYSPSTSCGQQENTNIQTTFEPDDTVYFITYYRDLLAGQQSTFRIKKPDGSLYHSWTYASTREHSTVTYTYWAKTLDDDGPTPLGTWKYEVDFEGQTYETQFYIGGPITITVKAPNGGEAWKPGTFRPIAWDTNLEADDTQFWLDLYKDNIFHTRVYTATPSDGFYFWGIPMDLPPGADYKVHIMDMDNPALYDMSDAPFTIAPVPKAQFLYSPVTGSAPLTVTFTDTSTSLIDTWSWSFGDRITSTIQDPTHTYTNTGLYTVTLMVNGPTGSHVLTHTNAITVTPPPLTADFEAKPLLGAPPMTVTFTDSSSGPPIDSWTWSFGDGVTSTLQHPSHIYTQTGSYSVSLQITAAEEEDVLTLPGYIRVVDRLWLVYLPRVTR